MASQTPNGAPYWEPQPHSGPLATTNMTHVRVQPPDSAPGPMPAKTHGAKFGVSVCTALAAAGPALVGGAHAQRVRAAQGRLGRVRQNFCFTRLVESLPGPPRCCTSVRTRTPRC